MDEHHAYLQLMLRLGRTGRGDFDVIHNHSLHYLPVAMAATVPVPIVCTLHTPPTPWLESAIQVDERLPGDVRRRQRAHRARPGRTSSRTRA